jgi:hypothetical protein
MNSQCDKTYLKKDDNNILDCSRVDRKSPALFINSMFLFVKNPAKTKKRTTDSIQH